MKNRICLLLSLLIALLGMTPALSEEELSIDETIIVESMDDFAPEDTDLLLDGVELPTIDLADILLEEDVQVANSVQSNDNSTDFEIINGVLNKYNGPGGDVVIPDGVTHIGDEAFHSCYNLTNVTIPGSVTSIGEQAFSSCFRLMSLTIPNGVTIIGEEAFSGCSSLTSITIPGSVTSIGKAAFLFCTGLTRVTFLDGVTSIGVCQFYGCDHLTNVTIPNSVTSIGSQAFDSCTRLTSVPIPDSVTDIGNNAFSGCTSLTSVTIPNSVTDIGNNAFSGCTSLRSVSLPQGPIVIRSEMFAHCSSLTSITIPDYVVYIGEHAFYDCPKLKRVDFGIPFYDLANIHGGLVVIPEDGSWDEAFDKLYNIIMFDVYFPGHPINKNAFEGCSTDLTFYTHCETTATRRAKELGYNVVQSDHTPVVIKGKAPTKTEYGKTDGEYCSACGIILVEQEDIPPLGSSSKISLSKCKITVDDQVYTGKALKPAVAVNYGNTRLVKGTDYTVSYKNNKAIGTATITIKGKGTYTGTVKKAFRINPKAVTLSSLTAGSKSLTVDWKKGSSITGYEVQYALKKSFASAKKVTIKKADTVKTVLKGLTPNKAYYVRIRAYKTVKGKKYFSAWSKVKSAKPNA